MSNSQISISYFTNYKSIKIFDEHGNYILISKLRLNDSMPFDYRLECKTTQSYYDLCTLKIDKNDVCNIYGQTFDKPIQPIILQQISQLFDL